MVELQSGGVWRSRFLSLLCIGLGWQTLAEAAHSQEIQKPAGPLLVFAGDIMAHKQNFSFRPFDQMYEPVADLIQEADLSFANLEFPIDDSREYGDFPLFNVHGEYVEAAIRAGFNVFSLANNHSADAGSQGVMASVDVMTRLAQARPDQGLWSNGLRPRTRKSDTPPARTMEVIEAKGWRIGFISLTQFVNLPSLSSWVQLLPSRSGESWTEFLEWLDGQRTGLDLLVLGIHWGEEYMIQTADWQKKAIADMVDHGVDIVWGHHPHVLQPWYFCDSPRGQALVMPSLGNFVSAQAWYLHPAQAKKSEAFKGDSMLFRVQPFQDSNGRIGFMDARPRLIAHRKQADGSVGVYPYQELLRETDPWWRLYFRTRFEILTAMIQGSLEASLVDRAITARLRFLPD